MNIVFWKEDLYKANSYNEPKIRNYHSIHD